VTSLNAEAYPRATSGRESVSYPRNTLDSPSQGWVWG